MRLSIREVKRMYETRRVRFRWWVRERVWCWSRSDRVVQTSPRPLTRAPDGVRSGTKTPSRMPNRVRSGTKTSSKHPHRYSDPQYGRRFFARIKNDDCLRKCRGYQAMTARSATRRASPPETSRAKIVFLEKKTFSLAFACGRHYFSPY